MFLFSLEQAITNHCLIPLTPSDRLRFSVCTVCAKVSDINCVSLSSALPFRPEDSVSRDDEHSPELLEGHLHQEEYDRCEHDAGTFGNQKYLCQ